MDWMIAYQDARRNMNDAEKIYAIDKVFTQKIREENKKKMLNGNKRGGQVKNQADVYFGVGRCNENKHRDRSTNTREQRAKLSGVSSGTISRYDTVMKSGDDELKQSMLSGDREARDQFGLLIIDEIENQNVYNR